MSAELIIYALVAAGLVFWLRSILGTRHGDEPSRPNPYVTGADPHAKPAVKHEYRAETQVPGYKEYITDLAQNPTDVLSVADKAAENGLLDILRADKTFDVRDFLSKAQDVFALVVEAFAEGDRDTLRELLAGDVYEAFNRAIADREAAGQTQQIEVRAITTAEIREARMDGRGAVIVIRFTAEETSVTRDEDGTIIAGHPDKVFTMHDLWVFSRTVSSADPRWLVSETRSDVTDDNDHLPNTDTF